MVLGACPARSPAIRCKPSTLSENFFHLGCRPREDGAFVGDHERAFDQNWVFDHRVEDLGFGCIGEPEFLVLRFALANGLAGLEACVGEEFFSSSDRVGGVSRYFTMVGSMPASRISPRTVRDVLHR